MCGWACRRSFCLPAGRFHEKTDVHSAGSIRCCTVKRVFAPFLRGIRPAFDRSQEGTSGNYSQWRPCDGTKGFAGWRQVQLALPADGACPEPVDLPLAPLYEDRDLLAVDKPAAMPVHPSPGHDRDSLANAAAAYFQKKDACCAFRPVYRLDRDTTGVLVLAKNTYAAARLAHGIEKVYLAVCEGILTGSGTENGRLSDCRGIRSSAAFRKTESTR